MMKKAMLLLSIITLCGQHVQAAEEEAFSSLPIFSFDTGQFMIRDSTGKFVPIEEEVDPLRRIEALRGKYTSKLNNWEVRWDALKKVGKVVVSHGSAELGATLIAEMRDIFKADEVMEVREIVLEPIGTIAAAYGSAELRAELIAEMREIYKKRREYGELQKSALLAVGEIAVAHGNAAFAADLIAEMLPIYNNESNGARWACLEGMETILVEYEDLATDELVAQLSTFFRDMKEKLEERWREKRGHLAKAGK